MSSFAPQFLNAFLLAVTLVLLLRDLARKIRLVDAPDERKRHEGHVPLVGGLAMFPAFAVASAMLEPAVQAPFWVVAGLAVLVVVGALDDRYNLPVPTRLALQIVAALALSAPIASALPADAVHAAAAYVAIVLFVVGAANAMNMIDGLDGLAGGVAILALLWLVLAGLALGRPEAVGATPLIFAALGFLVFNVRCRWRAKASVFMGDAGSLMLGAAIAYFVLVLGRTDGGGFGPPLAALVWVVALPLIETLSLIARRWQARLSPFSGDRRHLHHLLVDAGLSQGRAAAVIVCASGLLGAVGYAGTSLGAPASLMLAGLAVVAGAHWIVVQSLERARAIVAGGEPAAQPPRLEGQGA